MSHVTTHTHLKIIFVREDGGNEGGIALLGVEALVVNNLQRGGMSGMVGGGPLSRPSHHSCQAVHSPTTHLARLSVRGREKKAVA